MPRNAEGPARARELGPNATQIDYLSLLPSW
jgi:hypothetical protein